MSENKEEEEEVLHGARTDIPMEPMGEIMVEQISALQPMEDLALEQLNIS